MTDPRIVGRPGCRFVPADVINPLTFNDVIRQADIAAAAFTCC
jgi:hypothetical protein